MERRQPSRPAGLVRVVRVAQAVVVGVGLPGQGGGPAGIAIWIGEPPGAVRDDVHVRIPGGDPAGHGAADPAATAEAVERQAGSDPEPVDPRQRAEQRVRIRGHRIRMADQPDHLGIGQEREPPDGAGHQRREPLVIGRQRRRGVIPRDAVDPARRRLGFVPAEDHPAVLALAVDQVVRVAEARHVAGQLVSRDGPQRDVLVIDRRRRDGLADHRRDLGRPDACRVDHQLRVDRATVGDHPADGPPGVELDPGHPQPGPDPDPERTGSVGHGMGRAVRVEMAVLGEVDRAVEVVRADRRHPADGLVGRDHLGIQPDPAGAAGGALELAQLIRARGQPQAARSLEDAQPLVQLHAVAAEPHHRRRGVEDGHEPGRLAGRSGRQLGLLHEQHVRPAGLGQVVRHAAAGDPAADHDDARLVHDPSVERRPPGASRRYRTARTATASRRRGQSPAASRRARSKAGVDAPDRRRSKCSLA